MSSQIRPIPRRVPQLAILLGTGSLLTYFYYNHLSNRPREGILRESGYNPLRLDSIHRLTNDTSLLRFKLTYPSAVFPVPSSVHVKDDRAQIMRPYTPVNDPDRDGCVDLVVKKYSSGSVSRFLHGIPVGGKVEMRGPVKQEGFSGGDYEDNRWDWILMIAGGTGITPMYQILRRALTSPNDYTKIAILFANRTEKDIILRSRLDNLAAQYPSRFKIFYAVDSPEEGWDKFEGIVNDEMVQMAMEGLYEDKKKEKGIVLVCGPEGFVRVVAGEKARDGSQGPVNGILKRLGYGASQVFKFD